MIKYLATIDAKGRLRVATISLFKSTENEAYSLIKESGLLTGKKTKQPEKYIDKGKAKRTVEEQANLVFNSEVKKFLDKGYKELDKNYTEYTEKELSDLISSVKTDSFGRIKPMLAKKIGDASLAFINRVKNWFVSKKIDGVRCLIYKDPETNEIHSISRGGGDYDKSVQHILTDERIGKLLEDNPNIILDGELYIHGKPLQYISGLARTEDANVDTSELEYWIFDAIPMDHTTEVFRDRVERMKEFSKDYDIPYESEKKESKIKFLTQIKIITVEKAYFYHDKFVENMFEGAVIKNADAPYRIGARTNDMLKIKKYQDAEAVVIDKLPGLRDVEDMVFVMQMPNGTIFKAKPMGSLQDKQEYWDNFEEKYKGKTGTYKYFTLSQDGVPTQPVFKCFRGKNE